MAIPSRKFVCFEIFIGGKQEPAASKFFCTSVQHEVCVLATVLNLLVGGAIPAIASREVNGAFQPRICTSLPVKGNGYIRCKFPCAYRSLTS